MLRREDASAPELEGAVDIAALNALRIAARSAHNRGVLAALGALPALMHLVKARSSFLGKALCPYAAEPTLPWSKRRAQSCAWLREQ